MALARATVAASVLTSICGGCLLFTDEINEAPRVTGLSHKGGKLLRADAPKILKADVTDDRDPFERLVLTWRLSPTRCAERRLPPAAGWDGFEYRLELPQQREFCVSVVAKDTWGAASVEHAVDFTMDNRAPKAKLEQRAPAWKNGRVKLYATVELDGHGSADEDDDELVYRFSVTLPDGSKIDPGPCAQRPGKERRCFPVEVPGRYAAQLVVEDSAIEASLPADLTFEVEEDRPPSLELSDPLPLQPLVVLTPGTRRPFQALQVTDDGSPYPSEGGRHGETIFVWYKGGQGDGPLMRLAAGGPVLEVSEALFDNPRPGDQFRIRLEVRDRLVDQAMQQRLLGPPCPEKQDLCEIGESRRWVTWKVQFVR